MYEVENVPSATAFRLVMAVITSGIDAYRVFSAYGDELRGRLRSEMSMDCGLRIPTESLQREMNRAGNVDIARLGCPPGSDGKTFFTNERELEQHRSGVYLGPSYRKPYDLYSNLAWFIGSILIVNLTGLLLISIYIVFRWILFGASKSVPE